MGNFSAVQYKPVAADYSLDEGLVPIERSIGVRDPLMLVFRSPYVTAGRVLIKELPFAWTPIKVVDIWK